MTTPSTLNTCQQIVTQAMLDAGLVQLGQSPNGEQFADCFNRLNQLITFETTQGLKLWLQRDLSITPVAGQQKYSIKTGGDVNTPKPMRAIQGYYLDSTSSNRRPIYPLSWDEWMRLSQTNQTGQVSQYFVDKQQLSLDVYMWLIPDATAATGTIHLLIEGPVTNFVGLTDTMNFPNEWGVGLHWMLAADICTGQPQAVIQRCEMKAKQYLDALRNWDVEDAPTQFVPDMQRMDPYGNQFV